MNPRAFISYSWSSAAHQQWVLDLATQLRENGVDVTIDKWDLKEGHDAVAFMEKMVTESTIKKVVVVLDRGYAEKADGRKGGVGTESQIISPEIYSKTDQNKFVGVISELDAVGKPYLPTFYKSRIYIDLSSADTYAQNFDQLLRWVFDKPAFPKPALGRSPEFLNETVVLLPTRTRARRAIDMLRGGSVGAIGALDEYFSALSESFENLRINRSSGKILDDAVVESIGTFLPYRNEFIEVISATARFSPGSETIRIVHKFFEQLIPYLSRPKHLNHWHSDESDNFKFLIHELFLYVVAIFIKHERYRSVCELLQDEYFAGDSPDYNNNPMQPYTIFRSHLQSLDVRNQRLNLNRASLASDLIKDRAEASGITLRDLMQADFVLFVRDAVLALDESRSQQMWWPDSLVWYEEYSGPFEIFARAESKRYFENIRAMLSPLHEVDLAALLRYFGPHMSDVLPHWNWYSVAVNKAANADRIGNKP